MQNTWQKGYRQLLSDEYSYYHVNRKIHCIICHEPNIPQDIFGNGSENLAQEIAELRQEIAALRAELAPVPSLIVTGRQALDEFKKLSSR